MQDEHKTKEQLVIELHELRERVAELEKNKAEHKGDEESLRAAEGQLKLILDTVPASIWQKNREGRYLQINKAFCDTVGLSAETILGKTDYDLFPEELADHYVRADRNILNSGIPNFGIEEQFSNRSGERGWSRTDKIVQYTINGNIAGTIGFALDITDRKQAEEALHTAHEQLVLAQQSAGAGVWNWDILTGHLDWSPELFRLFGLDPCTAEATFDTWRRVMHLEDREAAEKRVHAAVHDRLRLQNEYRVVLPSGETRWISAVGNTSYDQTGRPLRMAGICLDITERKETDKELRDSETQYRRIVDTANDGIWSVDENFITTFVNRRMARMLGYDEPELIGRPVHWFMLEEDLANLREKMRDRRAGISDRYERRYRHKDGRSVWVILSVTPLVDDKDASFKGSFAMVTDISDRKHMEEELFKSRDELELRVRERTAELERVNSQLRSIPSKLIAVQEDERKRIAGELHDSVGQTLAALKYGIETVLVKKDGGDLVGAFNLLERFVPTLQRSIDETRGIYMGLRPPMLDSLGLLATLEWFCREFQSLHSSFRLELKTIIKEEEIPDMTKIIIFRIAQEALNNAAKHSRAKRVNLLLAKSLSSIELTIKDDGEGFEPDSVLSHNDLKSLGLKGMRDRAKLGGGIFSIKSTPGKGTVLRASWPAR
jgi:PAS domain S-box-containing protein